MPVEPVEPPVAGAGAAGAAPEEVLEEPLGDEGAEPIPEELPPAGAGAAEGAAGAADARMVAVPGEAGAAGAGVGEAEPPAAALGAAAGAEPDEPEEPAAPHLGPVGPLRAWLFLTTDWPGSGNWTSVDSVVVQSVAGMLATNMAGKDGAARPSRLNSAPMVELRLASSSSVVRVSGSGVLERFWEPPVTTMGAQFMYISRLPILLNHVQANA